MPKSTKAKKVGDIKQQKAWLKKTEPSKYAKYTVSLNKTILIVCEGQTEELYFKSFPVYGLTVETLNMKGQSKLVLVEKTKSFVKRCANAYDEIWCVFDMDKTRGEQEFADFDNAITKAKLHGYEVAYSNDAFELWFYLHFNYSDQKNLRDFYYEALGKIWGINYVNDGKKYNFCCEIYDLLKIGNASQLEALQRAEKLYLAQEDLNYHQQNPITMVYKLVMLLNENLRR